MRAAAHIAKDATFNAMRQYAISNVVDEDDLTGVLVGELNSALNKKIRGFKWNAKILRHRRGVAAEEKRVGADLLVHVSIKAGGRSYNKGVLVQAKRVEPGEYMTNAQHDDLQRQCAKMISHSPSSFVFDYARKGMRVGSATRIQGTAAHELYSECTMTPFRFFYDLFMCPIGDSRIGSTDINALPLSMFESSIPHILTLEATSFEKKYD